MKKQKNNSQGEDEKLMTSESIMQENEVESLRKKLFRLGKKYSRLKKQNEAYFSATIDHCERKDILEKENKNLKSTINEQRLTITMLTHCLYLYSDKSLADQNSNSSNEIWRDIELKRAMKILIPLAHSAKNDLLKKHNLKEFSDSQN